MIFMKKFEPAITIWNVMFVDKTDMKTIIDNEYFLSYKRAKKYVEKCEKSKEFDDVVINLGGEPLWL